MEQINTATESNINQLALLELSMELKALQRQRPRTPEDHRNRREQITAIGELISFINYVENNNEH
ncbi:hypothetical protein GZ77_07290 [Endozoicomonas montiporae]|uniref:Uncharacterized protein n=2 Tax=Endozoicomonas montiporae TaxID=1027273 RepID=A0A081N6Z7_9GAMM|nr:hypothetical protein [Endozoicomonas montiporae]AMO55972.1 hypothetical protein EZMO1_1829 [Endozoicomonas montiporae CL-33]KEQ14220.1 hypothetical protein GZ77_07290 [Endozoicomonas montiporae]